MGEGMAPIHSKYRNEINISPQAGVTIQNLMVPTVLKSSVGLNHFEFPTPAG